MNNTGRRALLIFNPAAGGGRAKRRAPDAFRHLAAGGLTFEVRETAGPGDATKLAQQGVLDGFTDLIAVGGDGTGFEVVNGLFSGKEHDVQTENLPRIGMLPLGTGNSFLRDFDILSEGDASPRYAAAPVDPWM